MSDETELCQTDDSHCLHDLREGEEHAPGQVCCWCGDIFLARSDERDPHGEYLPLGARPKPTEAREKSMAYIDSMPVYPHSVLAVSSRQEPTEGPRPREEAAAEMRALMDKMSAELAAREPTEGECGHCADDSKHCNLSCIPGCACYREPTDAAKCVVCWTQKPRDQSSYCEQCAVEYGHGARTRPEEP